MSLWCHDQKPKGSGIIEGENQVCVHSVHFQSHDQSQL